jgi:predicted transcriptional regulator
MTSSKIKKPTDSEMEILSVLWPLGKATVREVHEILSEQKDCGYTTTLKLMQIMHEKKILNRNESNKSHVYEPAVSKESVQQQSLNSLISSLFSGSPARMVLQALGDNNTTADELEEIENYISFLKSRTSKK